jgi:hypothetical protein
MTLSFNGHVQLSRHIVSYHLIPHHLNLPAVTKVTQKTSSPAVTKVMHAQSPLVRASHIDLDIEVEILMNNELGVQNSRLLRAYSNIDPRVQQLVRRGYYSERYYYRRGYCR